MWGLTGVGSIQHWCRAASVCSVGQSNPGLAVSAGEANRLQVLQETVRVILEEMEIVAAFVQ